VREWLKGLEREDRKVIGEDIKDVEFSWPDRDAAGSLAWEQIVGSAKQFAAGRIARIISRLYEEEPNAASTGHRSGA
jgi:hypothetical protein